MNDILDEMTKAELIAWIRDQYFLKLPKKSELLFNRWRIKSDEVLAEKEAHIEKCKNINFKKRDEYAKKFNESNDINEKVKLAELMRP